MSDSQVPQVLSLAELRSRGVAALAELSFPTSEEEVWRYSRIDELAPDAFAPAEASSTAEPAGLTAARGLVLDPAALVVVVDGQLTSVELDEALAHKGLSVRQADDADVGAVGSLAGAPTDWFAALNDAHVAAPVVVQVPAGLVVERPVVAIFWHSAEGRATFPRLVVDAGADSQVSVLEVHGSEDVSGLVVPVTELNAGPAARLSHLVLQDLGERVWQVGRQHSSAERDATFTGGVVALGGGYARLRIDCRLVGRGASGNLRSAYFGAGDQTIDLRTFQDHRAPDTTSDLLFYGALGGASHSVYTGLIRVRPDARGTDARQTNRNIKLSEDAWAESVPNLEIENNDVRCSHASSVGPVDVDQLFYLESRGVPPQIAERLIVGGFFEEVLRRLPVAEVVPTIRARFAQRLESAHG